MNMKKRKTIYIAILFLIIPLHLYADAMKKVLILDFINIEKKNEFQYLEASITDAVTDMLTERFVFKKMPQMKAAEIADTNYLYRDDFYTKSVGMNLGLLAKQDIVISGGYKITGNGKNIIIVTVVRIFDISKKKMLSEFSLNGPADDRIWNTIGDIASRISNEARSILPSKEDWAKSGLNEAPDREPIFGSPKIGIRGGGFFYSGGWAEYFSPRQPAMGMVFSWNMPVIWDKLFAQFEFYYMNHTLKEGNKVYVQRENMSGTTNNYVFGLFPIIGYSFLQDFSVYPKIGAGWILQLTSVTGENSSNFSNSFPFIGAGLEFAYRINKIMSVIIAGQSMVEIEKGVYTYVHVINLGISFNL